MKTVFIIHGSNGTNTGYWLGWLKGELEQQGVEVINPQFPIGKLQSLDGWLKTLEREQLDQAILVTHSLGGAFILNVLNLWDIKVEACFLVGGFVGKLKVEGAVNIEEFSMTEFDWNLIKERCPKFFVIASTNDPQIPVEKSQELADNLGVDVNWIEDAGHFLEEDGFNRFEQLLSRIEEEI